MKIVIDCRMIGSGGIGSYISSLLPLFIKDFECFLIGNKNKLNNYLNLNNVTILDCNIATFSIRELFFFPKKILEIINQCDYFYTPYCNIPKGIQIPIFSTIHDVVFLDINGLSGLAGTLIRKIFYQHAINKSKIVFTVSNFSKERIAYHLNTKNVQLVTTYNALPPWFSNDVNISIHKDNFVLFVGNIKKHKGLHTLIPAFKNLLNYDSTAKLVIVGNADNFRTGDNTIWNEIGQLPESSVQFTGRISDSELKEIYSKAKVLVQPSLYEGFGMPPLEALNLDTDVVLSDIPVFKEIYKDFPVTYFKCEDSNDLSEKLINNWNSFGKSSITVPQIYSFEKTYKIIFNSIAK